MLSNEDEALARAAFAPVRDLEPGDDLLARVLSRASRGKRVSRPLRRAPGRPRLALQGLAVLALLGVALYSVPVTRAAIEDAGGSVASVFSGWSGGGRADAPGAPLRSGEAAPAYLYDHHFARDPRVIAQAGGYKLFAYVDGSGGIGFDLGDTGVGMGFASVRDLGRAALQVLGPGAMQHADSKGHVPLFGLAARSVRSVELTYASGPPLVVDGVEGGFVLLADPSRGPREVVARNADGEEIGHQLVDASPHRGPQIEWSRYARSSTAGMR